jgi:hypothetical protein
MPLPLRLAAADHPRSAAPLSAPIGIEDVTGDDVMLDLAASHVAVIGRPRTGRSTTLRTIAAGLAAADELYAVGAATSGLASAPIERACFGAPDEVAFILDDLVRRGGRGHQGDSCHRVLLVDDLELLDDIGLTHVWERVAACPDLRIVAAIDVAAMAGFTSNPLALALRRSRQMLVLQPDEPGEFLQVTGVRLDVRPGTRWVPGRCVLVADRVPRVVQISVDDDRERRTPVRSRDTVSNVTMMTTRRSRTAAIGAASRR